VSLLEVHGLAVHYGGIRAVKDVGLAVAEGETVCVIGANGAGKSTTLRALAGLAPAARGTVAWRGRDITALPAHRRVRLGLSLVPEGRGVFPRMSVTENLLMGAYARADAAAIAADLERIHALFPRLAERRGQIAGTLSGGEQQMLAVGRALMGRPQLLLLDEPSMGLSPLMVEKIFETLRAIAAQGVTLLLVEQNANLALQVSDRGYVLENGAVALHGPAPALLADPRVRAAYLGGAE
jgi:branched-chain amino acid transport system ATP-binding protein